MLPEWRQNTSETAWAIDMGKKVIQNSNLAQSKGNCWYCMEKLRCNYYMRDTVFVKGK